MEITRAEAVHKIHKARGFMGIVFVKKNGEVRTMNCLLGVKVHLSGGKDTTAHIPAYITLWDRHAPGYRKVDVNRVLSLATGGERYKVN